MKLPHARHVAVLLCLLHFASTLAEAEKNKVVVLVLDFQDKPIIGLKIGIEGSGDAKTTGEDGKAILTLAGDAKENDWVSFYTVECPPGEDYVIVAPADHRHTVPSFDNKPENFVKIKVVQREIYNLLMTRPKMRESTTRIKSVPGKQ
jgi:hypothetical protein